MDKATWAHKCFAWIILYCCYVFCLQFCFFSRIPCNLTKAEDIPMDMWQHIPRIWLIFIFRHIIDMYIICMRVYAYYTQIYIYIYIYIHMHIILCISKLITSCTQVLFLFVRIFLFLDWFKAGCSHWIHVNKYVVHWVFVSLKLGPNTWNTPYSHI